MIQSARTRLMPLALSSLLLTAACTSTGRQEAARGAATGAAAGAVGSALSAAIFGGDIGEAAARGAAWGAGSGAVYGAARGDQKHRAQEDRERAQKQAELEAEIAKLKKEIGDDAYDGLAALTEGKHEVALGYARTALKDKNDDFARAGLWLEALTYADSGDQAKVDELLPQLAKGDPDYPDAEAAGAALTKLEGALNDLRAEFGIEV